MLSHRLAFSVHSFDPTLLFLCYHFPEVIYTVQQFTHHLSPVSPSVTWPFVCPWRIKTCFISSIVPNQPARPHLNASLFLDLVHISIISSHHPHLINLLSTQSPSCESPFSDSLAPLHPRFPLIPYRTAFFLYTSFLLLSEVLGFDSGHIFPLTFSTPNWLR